VRSEAFASRRDTLAFVVCLLLSLAARAAPEPIQDRAAAAVRSTVLAPFLWLQQQAELFRTSRARFAAVVAERDLAARTALLVDALREENARLRELLDLRARLPVRHVAAEVLHQSLPTDGLTLLLAAGADQGVQRLAPVLAPAGLLGVVRSVEATRSIAIIWPHPDFRAAAMTLDGSVFGMVAAHGSDGPNTALMELSGVPYRDLVPPGTQLYTAGFGGVYPRGIPIGRVMAIAEEQEGWARTYVVRPAVHPASVSHVIILTQPAVDLTDTFRDPPS
jgi:rod shape-determining protein MreC